MHAQTLLGLVPLVLSGAGSLRNFSNVLNPTTEAYIKDVLTDWNSPGGIAVAVVRRDGEGSWHVETKGYGAATQDGQEMTENTLFSIASNSKLFTVVATGLLINNETLSPRLTWTTKFASMIPGWRMADRVASRHLTIKDAMSHRSGLPRHDMSYRVTDTLSDVVEKIKHLPFSAEFRDVFQYCNTMYSLLSTLPGRVLPSKTSFTDYVKQHIFDPLGMNSTTYSFVVANATGKVADGLTREGVNFTEDPFADGTLRSIPFLQFCGDIDADAGAGGVISNAVDLATWLKTLLLNGAHPITNATIIPPNVIDKAATGVSVWAGKARFPELSPVVYGGGQGRSTYRGHEMIEHGGGIPGYNSQITRFPDLGLGVMVFSNDNSFGSSLVEIIKYRLIDEALGLEPVDWNTRRKELLFQSIASRPVAYPRPDDVKPPSLEFWQLTGTYHNPGYGPFELCLIYPPVFISASQKCLRLFYEAPQILPGIVKPGVPTYLAEWNSPWGTHIRLSHFDGNTFNFSLVSSFSNGNKTHPYWSWEGIGGEPQMATAQFGPGGIGLTGIWGAGLGVPGPEGATIRERAEVWFDKDEE